VGPWSGEDAFELGGVCDAVFAAVDAAGLGFGDDAAGVAVLGELLGQLQVLVFLVM
jgi:hypothetical protein